MRRCDGYTAVRCQMRNPVCPHCKEEITFSKSLFLSNPFDFKCPLCKGRIKQVTKGLVCVLIIAIILGAINGAWLYYELKAQSTGGIIISLVVLFGWWLIAELLTHNYLAKNGVTKNDVT